MVVLFIIAGLFLFAYVVHILRCAFFTPLLLMLGITALAIIVPWIAGAIRERIAKNPKLTDRQIQALAEARQKDETARARNEQKRAAAQAEHDDAVARRHAEIDEVLARRREVLEADAASLQKEFEKLEKMDIVGSDEKDIQTVALLIHLIETRRADDIKEALHEYDKLKMNEQLLQVEREKVEVERQRVEQEHADRVKQMKMQEAHNDAMRFSAYRAEEANREIAHQLDHIGYLIHTDVTYNR